MCAADFEKDPIDHIANRRADLVDINFSRIRDPGFILPRILS